MTLFILTTCATVVTTHIVAAADESDARHRLDAGEATKIGCKCQSTATHAFPLKHVIAVVTEP